MSDAINPRDIVFRLKARDLWEDACLFAADHGILVDQMLGTRRLREFILVRHAFWHRLHDHHELCVSTVARLVGRDHSSVLYGIDRHLNRQPKAMAPFRTSRSDAAEGAAHVEV